MTEGDPPRKKKTSSKRRGRRRRGPSDKPLDVEARADRVLRELRELVWALAKRKGVAPSEVSSLGEIETRLTVLLGRKRPPEGAVASLLGDIEGRLDTMLRASVAYRRGHVYDHFSGSPDGESTRPPGPESIFVGYTSSGRPRWKRFTNVCLERGEERVDQLYGERPEVIALVHRDASLNEALLEGFDAEVLGHRIRGQVSAGLIPRGLDPRRTARDELRMAISVQVVELASGSASDRLRLNVIGLSDEALVQAAAKGGDRGPAEALRRTLRRRAKELAALARRVYGMDDESRREHELRNAVSSLLHGLRGDIERVFRPVRRRTRHAQDRHLGGARPTGDAMSDVAAAGTESFFRDVTRDTVVVLGPKGRAHIFSKSGRHVTSLRLGAGELDRKTGQGRWRAMDEAEIEVFRERWERCARA